MNCGRNSYKDEYYKPRKSHRNTPSFSSTLLDEIYRSIDKNVEKDDKTEDIKVHIENTVKKQGSFRACLVEKWMENEKIVHRKRPSLLQDNNSVFSRSDSRRKSNVSCVLSDDDHRKDDLTIKPKSTAIKIYSKIKQPISPGGRLTRFINSLFKSISSNKKSKNVNTNKEFRDLKSRDEMRNGVVERTVRFCPVSSNQDLRKPPLPPNASLREKNREIEEARKCVLNGYNDFSMLRRIHVDEDEDDDGISDSSSDLFELDHSALFGNNIFSEELPVYETTRFDMNRAIASVF